jgi:hypothetical protein
MRGFTAASAIGLCVAAGPCEAAGQEPGPSIEVTGSRIRGVQGEPSTPVQVVT